MTQKLIDTIIELVETTSEQRKEIKELKAKLTTVEAKNKSLLHLQNVIDSKVISGMVEAERSHQDVLDANNSYKFIHAFEATNAVSNVMIVIESTEGRIVAFDSSFFK